MGIPTECVFLLEIACVQISMHLHTLLKTRVHARQLTPHLNECHMTGSYGKHICAALLPASDVLKLINVLCMQFWSIMDGRNSKICNFLAWNAIFSNYNLLGFNTEGKRTCVCRVCSSTFWFGI